jgi:short-subunit dehydrogenase
MNKVAIVTGASSGIGLAVAQQLAERGVKLALVARTRATLEEVARKLDGVAFPLDVTDIPALCRLPAQVVDKLGRLDIVINNAGVHHRGPILRWEPEKLVEIVTANLSAPIALTRAAVDHMPHGGSIVNVASLAGFVPLPEAATYSASKAGLRAFSRASGIELAPRGIRVSTVSPGPVDTPFFGDLEKVPSIVFSQPMSSAEEVARAVLRCIDEGTPEIAMPGFSGVLATVGYLLPGLARRLRPLMERRGEKQKRAYMARLKQSP